MVNVKNSEFLAKLALVGVCIAFCVIGLGALTRLVDAGLGCPDWPGCYGKLFVSNVTSTSSYFVAYKAWAEMIHRYFAAALSLVIIAVILDICFWNRKRLNLTLTFVLTALVIYQILLGKWTVTLRLLPIVVTQHLLGGFLIISSLWLVFLGNQSNWRASDRYRIWIPFAVIALFFLLMQIFLGAWTSTNYASLSCEALPYCHAVKSFSFHWIEAFNVHSPVGVNYEGGVLSEAARATIQMTHRMGALIVTTYIFIFSLLGFHNIQDRSVLRVFTLMLGLLFLQIMLGMSNVLFQLPLWTAVLHNWVAMLLLLTSITLIFRLSTQRISNED